MPLDARVTRFLRFLAASKPSDIGGATVDARRIGLADLMKFAGPAPVVASVRDATIPGPAGPLGLRIYSPIGISGSSLAGLVYFHGGGFVAGTLATHDWIARTLANAGACRVIAVDYRLAPEHKFPAALDDAMAAVMHVSARAADFEIDRSRLGVCGDSAGATLAAAVCQAMAHLGVPPLTLQLLICPILDHDRATESARDFAEGYLVSAGGIAEDLLHYLPDGVDARDWRVSPLHAESFLGLPRALVHTAEFDPLRDEGHQYYQRLKAGGSALAYTCHPGMIHLFYGLGSVIPYAHQAFDQIGGELRGAMQ